MAAGLFISRAFCDWLWAVGLESSTLVAGSSPIRVL